MMDVKMRRKMKKIILLACWCLALVACEKEEVSTFNTHYTALNIWVGSQAGAVYESVDHNFSYVYEEGDVTFYAQLSGMPADHDRTFHLEAFGGDSAQVINAIRLEDYVIPAGAVSGVYQVHFNTQKLSDPNLFTTEDGIIYFRVVPNDEFALGTEGHQQFAVVLKNYLAKPSNWEVANYPQMPLDYYFGAYSRVKYQFMIEHLGMKDFQVNYNAQTSYDEETNVVSNSYAIYLVQVMQRALADYNAEHSEPLVDEFGLPITF
jgi:hypothetical protein